MGKNEHTIKLIGLCKEVSNNRPIINLFQSCSLPIIILHVHNLIQAKTNSILRICLITTLQL